MAKKRKRNVIKYRYPNASRSYTQYFIVGVTCTLLAHFEDFMGPYIVRASDLEHFQYYGY